MRATELISDDFRLLGALEFNNAERYKKRGIELLDGAAGQVAIDFGSLPRANSLAVAVLLGWQRRAQLTGKSIVLVNLSHDLRKIIEFSGLSRLLLP